MKQEEEAQRAGNRREEMKANLLLLLLWIPATDCGGEVDVILLAHENERGCFVFTQVFSFFLSRRLRNPNVHLGVVLYGEKPRTLWHLSTHNDRVSLQAAMKELPKLMVSDFKESSNLGAALKHVLQKGFQPPAGLRPDARKILLVLNCSSSADSISLPLKHLHDSGIQVLFLDYPEDDGPQPNQNNTSLSYKTLTRFIRKTMVTISGTKEKRVSVRLLNGSSPCSGTLELRSKQTNQTWSSLCEDHLDHRNAKVFCSELRCGPPAIPHVALYTEAPMWSGEFHCKGNESSLLHCDSSAGSACTSGQAAGLTCSEPVRLVGGPSSCVGILELKRPSWRAVEGPGWSLNTAATVCRRIQCGSPLSVLEVQKSSSVWWVSSYCVQAGFDLLECASADSALSVLNITCSDWVRLVNGSGLCSGDLQVRTEDSWSTVCGDLYFDEEVLVCEELQCEPPEGLHGAAAIRKFDFLKTRSSPKTCSPGRPARLRCSDPVRLVGGASRCAGTLELKLGSWRPVEDRYWTLSEAATACKELKCGSAVRIRSRNQTWVEPMWRIQPDCLWSGFSIRECATSSEGFSSLELVCSDLLLQPIVWLSEINGVSRGLWQGSEVFWGSSFTISCSIQPQYPGGSFLLTSDNASYAQTAVNHSAHFLFPAADSAHQGDYSCFYLLHVFGCNFSSRSRRLSVGLSDPTAAVVRLYVLLPALIVSVSIFCCIYKANRSQEQVPADHMELAAIGGPEEDQGSL